MSSSPFCDKEAQFIKAHHARTAAINQERHDKDRNRDEFWKSLHMELSLWKERLDNVQVHSAVTLSAKRNETGAALDALSEELKLLRKQCLSDLENIDLPVTDVRLLHDEFTTHFVLLEAARESLSPRSKFVFKRYREAQVLKEKNNKDRVLVDSNSLTAMPSTRQSADNEIAVKFGGTVIENHSDACVVMEANGVVTIKRCKDGTITAQNDENDDDTHSLKSASASILLKNLFNCRVVLNRSFQAVHLQNVNNGSVQVTAPIGSACHITSCHHLRLTLESHQLRIHESSDLDCFVITRSCPILENCMSVSFYYDPNDKENAVSETKDFNWLRNGIPSPNFTLIPQTSNNPPADQSEARSDDPSLHDISVAHDSPIDDDTELSTDLPSAIDDDDDEL